MNFTQVIKREIIASLPKKDCCKRAFLRALLTVSGKVTPSCMKFTSENERVSEYYFSLMEHFGLRPQIDGAAYDARNRKDRIDFSFLGEEATRAYELLFSEEILKYKKCCAVAYARGAFLGGGSCSLPRAGAKSGYHLQFTFQGGSCAEGFCELLESLFLCTRTIRRVEKEVVYLKKREEISDFLLVIGATSARREFEAVLNAREENNFINRVENCMAGNADKSMTASAGQVHLIQQFKERTDFSRLPQTLKDLAQDRLNNPTLSLSELAQKTGVSKSCLNHRMRKLMEICRRTEV